MALPSAVPQTRFARSKISWTRHWLFCAGEEKRYVCYWCNSTANGGCGPAFNESSVRQVWCQAGQVCIKTTTRAAVNGQK